MKFFDDKEFFFVNLDFKNGCKNEFEPQILRIITKNHAADSKIGSPLKIDFRADWTHVSIPTGWELKLDLILNCSQIFSRKLLYSHNFLLKTFGPHDFRNQNNQKFPVSGGPKLKSLKNLSNFSNNLP